MAAPHRIPVETLRRQLRGIFEAWGMAEAVTVRYSRHYGAAGVYALLAARQGLIGLASTNAGSKAIVPTRARDPVLGTNPIAFAAPAKNNKPFVIDMAANTAAVGKGKLAVYNGKPLPEGRVLDPAGAGVHNAPDAFDGFGRLAEGYGMTLLGGLAALSSHKGYGLAAMIDHLHGLPPTDPDLPVLVPGDPEDSAYADRLANGVPIPELPMRAMADVCRDANIEFLLNGSA